MPLLGAHMSIAGGYYKAIESAAELDMECVQLFTKNVNQWKAKPITDEDVKRFRDTLQQTGLRAPCAHDSYLINLGSPDQALWQKSLDAFVHELERAEMLGLIGLVMHPGSFVTSTEEAGLERITQGLEAALERTAGFAVDIWLETTAGQGTNLGHRFEQLATILGNLGHNKRLGICVDSCHLFAAGYPLQTPKEYAATMDELDRIVGIQKVRAFHLNDSKRELGSRVDRHAGIGEGCLGLRPFQHILNDPRFAELPMYMETPKGIENGENLDSINLSKLRGLLKKSGQKRAAQTKSASTRADRVGKT